MPQLTDIVEKRKKQKFVKKSYRPWDLSGNTNDNLDKQLGTSQVEHAATENTKLLVITDENPQKKTEKEIKNTSKLNWEQTGDTQGTNWKQTGNDNQGTKKSVENIQGTIREQTGNKLGTNWEHTGSELGNDSGNKNLIESIKKLSGIQEKIFFFVVELCLTRGSLDTGSILTSEIANIANCSYESTRVSIKRLIRKELLIRNKGKASRGGHIKLGINNTIRESAVEVKKDKIFTFNTLKNIQSTSILLGNELGNDSGNGVFTNSSSNLIKNKTTTNLPEEWKNIIFEPLSDIGFSETQLFQLYEKNLSTPEIVQESINHFAYALEYSPKCQEYKKDGKNPLNILMGVLRKGGAWFEAEYISPKEKALKELVEFKKKEAERIRKLEEELLQYEFEKWFLSKSEDELNLLIADKREPGTTENIWKFARKGNLLNYFRQNVFHKIKLDKQE